MAVPNLVSLIALSGVIVAETRRYLWTDNLDAEAPPTNALDGRPDSMSAPKP